MICWYCHWGWPVQIRAIYDRAEKDIDTSLDSIDASKWAREPRSGESALKYGPAHVVWEDENWDSAEWCLAACANFEQEWYPGVLEIVRRSLRELIALPDAIRYACPKDYDGANPENYPPTVEMEK